MAYADSPAYMGAPANNQFDMKVNSQVSQQAGSIPAPLTYDVVSQTKLWKGNLSTTYHPASSSSQGAPSFYINHESRRKLVLHRGLDESGEVIGRVEVPKWRSPDHTEIKLPMDDSGDLDAGQQMHRSGVIHRAYSVNLPSVAAALRLRSPTFSWRRTSKGAGYYMKTRYALMEGEGKDGREVASYVKKGTCESGDGQFELLAQGLDQTALEEMVVASVAFVECIRLLEVALINEGGVVM